MGQIVVCPLCSTRLRVKVKPSATRRQRVKCSKCGSVIQFTVEQSAQPPAADPFADDAVMLEDASSGTKDPAYELEDASDPEIVDISGADGTSGSDLPDDLARAMSLSAGRDYHAAAPQPKKRKKPKEESISTPGGPVATPDKDDTIKAPLEATFELAGRKTAAITPWRVIIAIVIAVFSVGLVFQLSRHALVGGPRIAVIVLAISIPLLVMAIVAVWIVRTLSPATLYVVRATDGSLYAEKTAHILMVPISTTEIDIHSYTLLETEKRVRRDTASGVLATTIQILSWVAVALSCGLCGLLYILFFYLGWQVSVRSALSDQGTSEDVYDVWLTGPTVDTLYFFRDESALTAGPAAIQLSKILGLPIHGDLARHVDPKWMF